MGFWGNDRDKHEAIGPKYRVVYLVGGKPRSKSGEYDTYEAAVSDTRGFQGEQILQKYPKGKVVARIEAHEGRWEKVANRTMRRK